MAKTASLILEDGTVFKGLLFGADVSVSGEVGESLSDFFTLLVCRLFFPDCIATVARRKFLLRHQNMFSFPFIVRPDVPRRLFS